MKKIISMVLVCILACMLFAGCSAPATQSSAAPSESAATQGSAAPEASQSAGADESAAPAADITIGYSFPTKNNEFWGNALAYVNQAADELGFKVNAVDANNEQEKQVNDVNNLLSSGINGLVLGPQDASVVPGILDACKAKNVPVIIIDRWPGDELKAGEDYVAFIGPNDEQAGYDIAMSLIDGGAKKIVGIGGYQGTSVAEGRKAGLDKALKEHPEVELLQFVYAGENMDDGDEAIRNLLQAHPDLDGVWCYNDSLALASVNVLKEQGTIDKVKVGGMDLLQPAIDSMKANELWFSTGGHYMQAADAAVILYDYINGHKLTTDPVIKINLLAVSQENMDKYEAKYGEGKTPIVWKDLSMTYTPDAQQNFDLSLD
ncbi:MAG: ABC transporter substrate-binding protein [Christensenella sp.]|uniref:ABC transporter substrate-binding protein n=1 Tax=Christensenella sp. TaxID=1935934 RepID=UPI002B1E91A0|nr:ABC transporter substrate-binding protein [Christensenella sp.]MEA5002372.1 ABC transporter substrate-binding protein [Christensenella sp.]